MLSRIDARKAVIFGLLALHTVWIANHLRLVYQDRINPWRLGGYGMYTRPNSPTVLTTTSCKRPGISAQTDRLTWTNC